MRELKLLIFFACWIAATSANLQQGLRGVFIYTYDESFTGAELDVQEVNLKAFEKIYANKDFKSKPKPLKNSYEFLSILDNRCDVQLKCEKKEFTHPIEKECSLKESCPACQECGSFSCSSCPSTDKCQTPKISTVSLTTTHPQTATISSFISTSRELITTTKKTTRPTKSISTPGPTYLPEPSTGVFTTEPPIKGKTSTSTFSQDTTKTTKNFEKTTKPTTEEPSFTSTLPDVSSTSATSKTKRPTKKRSTPGPTYLPEETTSVFSTEKLTTEPTIREKTSLPTPTEFSRHTTEPTKSIKTSTEPPSKGKTLSSTTTRFSRDPTKPANKISEPTTKQETPSERTTERFTPATNIQTHSNTKFTRPPKESTKKRRTTLTEETRTPTTSRSSIRSLNSRTKVFRGKTYLPQKLPSATTREPWTGSYKTHNPVENRGTFRPTHTWEPFQQISRSWNVRTTDKDPSNFNDLTTEKYKKIEVDPDIGLKYNIE